MDTGLLDKNQTQNNQPPQPEKPPLSFKSPKKKRNIKRIVALVLVVAVAATVFFVVRSQNQATKEGTSGYTLVNAENRNITVSLGGSGALKAADSYMVTALLSGEILSADFEEGGSVSKDDVLYIVDSSDILTSIERAELARDQSQSSLNRKLDSRKDLNITAKNGGEIVSLFVEKGDTVSIGTTIASVRDSSVMKLSVPFSATAADGFFAGQGAKVVIDGSFETLDATIFEILPTVTPMEGNVLVKYVTLEVKNPGGLSAATVATASIGGETSVTSGQLQYKSDYVITSSAMGEIASLPVAVGDRVAKGQTVAIIDSKTLDMEIESLESSLRDANLNVKTQTDRLNSYTIKSPIGGTIIEKNYKEGDMLESGRVLCTIFDLSYLSVTLNVDELDISMVQVGQVAKITAEALPGREFSGVVTRININGTTMNSVTSYPVTLQIDEADGLLPGMNVDALIDISFHENVLTIPADSVLRGGRVLVQTDPNPPKRQSDDGSGIPAGFEYKEIELGASDGEYVQVLSGLQAGDVIASIPTEEGNYIMTPFGRVKIPAGSTGN